MNTDTIRLRARIVAEIRRFLTGRNYLEVDTPLLSPHLIPESHLEVFATELVSPDGPSHPLYLIPSPEVWHKQLLAAGCGSLFEITRCFRNGEQRGAHHNPEFTMLEYYTVDADETESIGVTESLFAHLLTALKTELLDYGCSESHLDRLAPPFVRRSVRDTVRDLTGIDLNVHQETGSLRRAAAAIGLQTGEVAQIENADQDSWESVFNHLFVDRVEPELSTDHPLVLYDYPARIRTLARSAEDPRYSRRWELYVGGVEVANCYFEESDPRHVTAFFKTEAERKRHAHVPHTVDGDYPRHFGPDFPRCSGVALGVDRLVMLFLAETNMTGVILFPMSDIILGK